MKPIDLDQLDKDMEAIVAAVSVPGSIPLGIMEASRPNHAVAWEETEDAKRFDENLLTPPTELVPHFDYQSAFVLSDSKFRPRIFKNISSLVVRPD